MTMLSPNGHAHSPTLIHTGEQWSPWLRGRSFSNHCVWCSLWGLAEKYSQWALSFCTVPVLQPSWEDPLSFGREPHHRKLLAPTTKILFKMGEKRWNFHHQKYPKTYDFTRTAHSLGQLKLAEWQLRSPDSPPRLRTLPSTQHTTSGNHYIWPSDNRGPPPTDISLKSISWAMIFFTLFLTS